MTTSVTYRSQKGLATLLMVGLFVWLIGTTSLMLYMLELIPLAAASLVFWPTVVATLALWIGFPIFFWRASKNLAALGISGLRYTPGQAARGFFIPLVRWVRPYRVAVELVRASDPSQDRTYSTSWMNLQPRAWVLAWFISFMMATMSVRMTPGFLTEAPGYGLEGVALFVAVLLGIKALAMGPAVWLARKLVLTIHEGQEALAAPADEAGWLRSGIGHVAEVGSVTPSIGS